ncbi:MAG TPA: integrase arm-type DNA-binding domain-containing protein [Rhodanobacteraceae bacterium]|nr:integrase arm-type DNA-binding domain-containing protein [Rhodanobacteraceae bacterium]
MKITDIALRAAIKRAKQTGARIFLACGDGLRLLVEPSGIGRWQLRFRHGSKERMVSFGSYPESTLAEAIEKTIEARRLIRTGIDPVEQRRADKEALRQAVANTFGAAAQAWYEFNLPNWKPATAEKARQYLDKDLLPSLRSRPISVITAPELCMVMAKIEARGALNVAKKTRQWLKSIFRFAMAKGWVVDNPAESLGAIAKAAPATINYAHIEQDELPALIAALDRCTGSTLVKGAIWLSLWSGNRPGITRTLRWSELDLDNALWTIEKDREGMKRGYAHLTPLPRQAVAMLRELHKLSGTFEYVFPGRNDPRTPMSNAAMSVALAKMGFKGRQTVHGFRHLVSTALNERGYQADWVERQLAHGDPDKIRGTYNKAVYLEPRRKMMQAWADYLDTLKQGGNVIPIRKRAG